MSLARGLKVLLLCIACLSLSASASLPGEPETDGQNPASAMRLVRDVTAVADEAVEAIEDGRPTEALPCQSIGIYDQPEATCRPDGGVDRCLLCKWDGDKEGPGVKDHTIDDVLFDTFNEKNDVIYQLIQSPTEDEDSFAHPEQPPDSVRQSGFAKPRGSAPVSHGVLATGAEGGEENPQPTTAPELAPAGRAASNADDARASAGVVAGAVVLAAAAVVAWTIVSIKSAAALRRMLATALFSRVDRDAVLQHPARALLHGQIQQEPGVHLKALVEASGLARATVAHHLRHLEHHDLVRSKTVGRSRHFFANGGGHDPKQKDAYALLRNERNQQVISFLEQHPGADRNAIGAAMGMSWNLTAWYLKRLTVAGLVRGIKDGRSVAFWVCRRMTKDPDGFEAQGTAVTVETY